MILLSQARKSARSMRTKMLRGACYVFLAFGVLALGYACFDLVDGRVYQAAEKKKFRQAAPLLEPRILAEGDVVGELQVPRLGLNVMVVQGNSAANLRRGVVHLSKSALPGEWGNVTVAGHRDTYFRSLRDIRLGDEIRFKTSERSYEYLVESVDVVAPGGIQVLEPATGHDLTLLTCFPFYYVGPAPKRFVVRAREVGGTP